MFNSLIQFSELGFVSDEDEQLDAIITPGARRLIAPESDDQGSVMPVVAQVPPPILLSVEPAVIEEAPIDALALAAEVPVQGAPLPRSRGRRGITPKVESLVRCCTRNNNDGYRFEALPNDYSSRRKSTVPKAVVPEVLQIAEMQRMGVEDCHINPDELSEERLLASRED